MFPSGHTLKFSSVIVTATAVLFLVFSLGSKAAIPDTDMESKAKALALRCQSEVAIQFEMLVTSGKLTMGQMFDTFYIPIPDTNPQRFKTKYDTLSDQAIQQILDKYLLSDPKLLYVVAVDRNGYVPTHNSVAPISSPGTSDADKNKNRSKRLFNDRTGLAAARNTEPFLVQKYSRDTGETMYDISVPLVVHKKHWGAIRIGYQP
jgi:hypothetical protein